ncbi:MAG: amidohydrolase family protein [Chloroflexota bacterium]
MDIDVLIRGGRIVDGSGNPWFYGDVAISGDRIMDVVRPGTVPLESAREVVDATGMVVCPGFIDIQSHSIVPLMVDGRCLSKITQGVTTEIMGEAWTPAPFGGRITDPLSSSMTDTRMNEWREKALHWHRFSDWLEAMVEAGVSPNIGSFLGGGTLREYARGMQIGQSSSEELATLLRVMEEAMHDGAFGVSYALIYPPDCYSSTDEIVDVCKVVSRYGGVYITHIRSEGEKLHEGVEEALEIGRRAALPVEIYHLKASGRSNWNKMPEIIGLIENARESGLDVTADMYPYVGSGTGLASVLPAWAAADGKFFENLRDPIMRRKIRDEVLGPSGDWEAMGTATGPGGIMPIGFDKPDNQKYVGRRLSDIAAERGENWVDTVINLLSSEEQRIFTIYFSMDEANLRLQMAQPWIKFSTDAGGVDPAWAKKNGPTHPRSYGTYPRVLGRYVREDKVLPLEDAVRKMSSAVADRLGLRDRGTLRVGCFADVVIFDSATVSDRATFDDSHQLSTGIRDVWVNGARVLWDGKHTGATPGTFLRGRGSQ